MPAWSSLPIFYPNSEQLDSATDLNRVREAVRLVDGWTFRNDAAFDSSTGLDTGAPGYYDDDANPLRVWWGAVRFVAGCTTLTIEGRGVQTGAELLKVYIGGTDVTGSGTALGTISLPGVLADFSQSFAISGYSDGDVIPIEIRVEGTHTTFGPYIFHDIYLSPISKAGWVAAPSFASVADATDAAKLNALCTACQWVYERIRLTPFMPRLALYYNLGPFKGPAYGDPQHAERPMYTGTVGRYDANAELRVSGAVISPTASAWYITIYLNGVAAYTSPSYGRGTQLVDVRLSLASYALGSRVRVSIHGTVTNDGGVQPLRFTRWTFGIIHAVANSSGWSYATLPAAFVGPSVSTNAEALRAKLASLASIVNAAKARIDARPERWARSRALRRHYTRNGDSEDLLLARARPYVMARSGSEFYVKGKDIKLAIGPITVAPDANSNGWEKYTFQSEQTVDDAENGTTVYLDNYPGLDYGAAFRVLGNPIYAAEYVG
jgi:hypothetical protein